MGNYRDVYLPPRTNWRDWSRQPSKGGSTRATTKLFITDVKAVTKDIEDVVAGPVTRLIGTQSGVDGFVLGQVKTITGTAGAASVVIEIKNQAGTTIYIDGSTSYS